MNTCDQLIKGIEIFKKYNQNVLIAAEHEEIYAGPEGDHAITMEDQLALGELGWHDQGDMGWVLFT